MTHHEGTLSTWNVHYVNLERLPSLRTDELKKLKWLNSHVALAFTDREARERAAGNMSAFTQVKDSIHAITMRFAGLQCDRSSQVFALNRVADGGIDTLFFVPHLKLDLAAHTFIFDAFVLPLEEATLGTVGRFLGMLSDSGSVLSIVVSKEELVVWKHLLPALAERCRTWKHKQDCAYARHDRIPLSAEHGRSPICACGRGIVTDAFKAKREWLPFSSYVTRVAISPLFALSYLDTIGQTLKDRVKGGNTGHTVSPSSGGRKCAKCAKELLEGKLSVCGNCKAASYCSRECQVADWKKHKIACKKT